MYVFLSSPLRQLHVFLLLLVSLQLICCFAPDQLHRLVQMIVSFSKVSLENRFINNRIFFLCNGLHSPILLQKISIFKILRVVSVNIDAGSSWLLHNKLYNKNVSFGLMIVKLYHHLLKGITLASIEVLLITASLNVTACVPLKFHSSLLTFI